MAASSPTGALRFSGGWIQKNLFSSGPHFLISFSIKSHFPASRQRQFHPPVAFHLVMLQAISRAAESTLLPSVLPLVLTCHCARTWKGPHIRDTLRFAATATPQEREGAEGLRATIPPSWSEGIDVLYPSARFLGARRYAFRLTAIINLYLGAWHAHGHIPSAASFFYSAADGRPPRSFCHFLNFRWRTSIKSWTTTFITWPSWCGAGFGCCRPRSPKRDRPWCRLLRGIQLLFRKERLKLVWFCRRSGL